MAFTEEKTDRLRDLINGAVRDCLATGYEPLIEALDLPDRASTPRTSERLPKPSDSADEGFQHGGAVEGPEPQVVGTGWFLQGSHPLQGGP